MAQPKPRDSSERFLRKTNAQHARHDCSDAGRTIKKPEPQIIGNPKTTISPHATQTCGNSIVALIPYQALLFVCVVVELLLVLLRFAMKVSSSAALGTLTIASNELAQDPVLQLIVKLASSLQLTVKSPKKASLLLELPSGKSLTQRNAIVRCLCGMGLHNALDNELLGGHSKTLHASPGHAVAMAAMSSWMSVADHHKSSKEGFDDLLKQLEAHLETRAFLVTSATVTVADIDVANVLVKKKADYPTYPNVHRWMVTVAAFVTSRGITSAFSSVPAIPKSHDPPIFFYGTEENVVLPTKAAAAPPAKKGGEQQPQQQQKGGGKKGQQQQQQGGKKQKQQQQQGGKKQKQQQQQAPATFDVTALDIRVGQIKKVWHHPEAEKLFCEEIDVGEESVRQIASGLRPFYKTEELENQRVMVLCNLKKRNLVGFPSHGMVMCASNADHTAVELMAPPPNAKIGERVVFEGLDEAKAPEPENKVAKKKIFESVAPDLKTNAEGVCVWKSHVSKTSDGPVKASKGMADAHVA